MQIRLNGGPHDGKVININPALEVVLPVIDPLPVQTVMKYDDYESSPIRRALYRVVHSQSDDFRFVYFLP